MSITRDVIPASLQTPSACTIVRLEDTPPSSNEIPSVSRLICNHKLKTKPDEKSFESIVNGPSSTLVASSPIASKYFRSTGLAEQKEPAMLTEESQYNTLGSTNLRAKHAAKARKRRSSSTDRPLARRRRTRGESIGTGASHRKTGSSVKDKPKPQARIKAPKVTKIASNRSSKDVSDETSQKPNVQSRLNDPSDGVCDDSLDLVKSVSRRRSWTPVEDSIYMLETHKVQPLVDKHDQYEGSVPERSGIFNTLEASFAHTKSPSVELKLNEVRATSSTRRKRMDLVNISATAPKARSNSTTKATKKKPRTITEKATESYRSAAVTSEGAKDTHAQSTAGAVAYMLPSKPRSRARKSKTEDSGQYVLQPEAAHQVWNQQEVVFGTCSQLVREDSPAAIRDLQLALQQSAEEMPGQDTGFISNPVDNHRGWRSTASKASKGLWTAASRDDDGSLFEDEFIDLTKTPITPSLNLTSTQPLLQANTGSQAALLADIEATRLESARFARNMPSKGTTKEGHCTSQNEDPSQTTTERVIPAKSPIEQSTMQPKDSAPTRMPDYGSWTDLDLQAAISKYGFKPMKRRVPMIKKLQKCWEAQHGPRLNLSPSTSGGVSEAQQSAKVTSGQPSGDPGSDQFGDPTQIQQNPKESTDQMDHTDSDERGYLFSKIREAIVTCPPTHDPKNLTWHEKILLHDPIVLEDLTVWLNSEGLNRVGVDEEVAPSFVRDWCESQSICCLWRLNLRGQERSRY